MGGGGVYVTVPAESQANVSAHGFLNQGATLMFNVRFINLNIGSSYLIMKPENSLEKD